MREFILKEPVWSVFNAIRCLAVRQGTSTGSQKKAPVYF
ncbi:hypothetical protein EPYR_00869 [Erwinia pyrifoliae DSM 12163]|nr:hypothetical protein EPYR_00869 [Erwinia pyrifoliae DSM 12163]